jgi:transcriptional regulator with XRE-family HTH domain
MTEELVFRIDRLDRLMEKRGLGLGELAYLSGVSYDMIYSLRKGRRSNVSVILAMQLAKALNTTVEFLVDVPPSEDENVLAEGKAPYNVAHLDEKQRAILDFFESLSDDEQEFVLTLAEFVRSRNTPRIIG